MINYETILSTFDDKLTLLQWLQKVEQALEGAGLESVEIHQQTPTTAYFKFIFADGTSVTTPSITLPRGAKGDTGATGATGATGNGIASISKTGSSGLVDTYTILYTNGSTQTFTVTNGAQGEAGQDGQDGADGVGIDDVEINGNTGVLTVTLTDETEINAGNVYNIVTISGTSGTITDPAKLLILDNKNTFVQRNYNEGLMVWHHTDNLNHVQYFYRVSVETNPVNYCDIIQAQFAVDITTGAWTYTETTVPFRINPEDRIAGVDIDGNIVASGKVLSADGDGGIAWDTVGGGSQLYAHYLRFYRTGTVAKRYDIVACIITNSSTPFTQSSLLTYMNTNSIASIAASGAYETATGSSKYFIVTGLLPVGSTIGFSYLEFDGTKGTYDPPSTYFSDTVITL